MHVARVPDFPPPIDQIAYVRAESVENVDLDASPPPPPPLRRRGREWAFGLTGLVLGVVVTTIVAPSAKHEAARLATTPAVATTVAVEPDLQALLGWDVAGTRHEAADTGYRNPLPVLLLGRP